MRGRQALKKAAIVAIISLLMAVSTGYALEKAGESSPEELVKHGQALNHQSRFAEAAELLEQALMINPSVRGGKAAYQAALNGLLGDEGSTGSNWAIKPTKKWLVSKQINIKVGASSNLNSAPSNSVIPLTIGGETIKLKLAADETEKAGQAIDLSLSIAARKQINKKEFAVLSAQLQQKKATQTGFTSYQWGQLAATWGRNLASKHQIIGGISIDVLNYQQQKPYYIVQGALRHRFLQWHQCSQQYGVDVQRQGQQDNKALDGRFAGAVSSISCHQKNAVYTAQVSAGKDWAVGSRLGGDQKIKKVQFQYDLRLSNNSNDKLKAMLSYYEQKDKKGYNSLLNNGSRRKVQRVNALLEYQKPLKIAGNDWVGYINIRRVTQHSNIALFETNTKELWLGLKRKW